jgi:hypothetical protein
MQRVFRIVGVARSIADYLMGPNGPARKYVFHKKRLSLKNPSAGRLALQEDGWPGTLTRSRRCIAFGLSTLVNYSAFRYPQ